MAGYLFTLNVHVIHVATCIHMNRSEDLLSVVVADIESIHSMILCTIIRQYY